MDSKKKEELNDKLLILKEFIKEGKLKVFDSLEVSKSLERVQFGADGMVDPSTVDGRVRALANAVTFFKHQEELKKIPLLDIQREYFEILETFFGTPFAEMKKHKLTPHQIAKSVASKASIVKALSNDAPNFKKGMIDFWDSCGPVVEAHIHSMNGLKTIYGGDFFPSYQKNMLSTSGLYADTTILPDPLFRALSMVEFIKPYRAVYYLTKHALSALAIKDLVLANVNPPIAIIAPDYFGLDNNVTGFIKAVGESDVQMHIEKIFGVKFQNYTELNQFLKNIVSVNDLISLAKIPDRLFFDTDWKELSVEERLKKHRELTFDEISVPALSPISIGEEIQATSVGRMMQINDTIFKAKRFGGVPLIEAPTSWQYFIWKYEYDQQRSQEFNKDLKNLLIVNSLESKQLAWLGNVPYEALIKLRKEGALSEMRSIFGRGISEITTANEKSYNEVVKDVISNIDGAFKEHKSKIEELSNGKKKFFGFDVAPWVVNGGIAVAATLIGNIPLGLMAAGINIFGTSSGRDLWKRGKEILTSQQVLEKSPVGILFNAYEKK